MKILNPKSKISNLKIGIVCYPSIGGSGVVATNLGLELALLGHQVHFISYDPPFRLEGKHKNIFFHKVHINEYSLFKYPDYTLPLAVEIEKVQRKHRLNILHVHYAVPHATAALLARRIMRQNNTPRPKVITTLHGTDITLLARDQALFEIIRYSIERSHGVTAVSDFLRRDTIKFLKTEKPIEVIYNFYTPPPITQTRARVRQSLKVKTDDFLAIHLSNLRPVKRIPDLLKIIAHLKDNSKLKLLILSGGNFTPYLPLVKKLGLQNRLILKQKVKDISNYINAADAGIFPSDTESFGMGILETMSYGKPVLASNAGGIPEVVDNKRTGFLFKVGDTRGFAKKLSWLINHPAERKKIGTAAKLAACEKFCSKKIVPEYLAYYRKIMEQK